MAAPRKPAPVRKQPEPSASNASLWVLIGGIGVLAVGLITWAAFRTPGPSPALVTPPVETVAESSDETSPESPAMEAMAKPAEEPSLDVFHEQPLKFTAIVEEPPVERETAKSPPPAPPDEPQPVKSKRTPIVAGAVDKAPVATKSAKGRDPLALAGRIDTAISKKLKERGLPPSPIAGDAEFLRRVTLDLNGRIPTKDETVAFLASTDPAKRSKLIDRLLARPEFGKHFAYYWRDLIAKREGEYQYVPNEPAFVQWMTQQYNTNPFWDKIVSALITARGDEMQHGETYLFLTHQDMQQPAADKLAATVTTLFMGTQLQCAECHVHPVHKEWKPKDFWGMAAFFANVRTDRRGDKKKVELGTAVVTEVGMPSAAGKQAAPKGKEIAMNLPGTVKIPDPTDPKKIIGSAKAAVFEGKNAPPMDRSQLRPFLAKWFASPRNAYFAPAHINRMWAYFFDRGFVNPVDDMRPDNAASHPELIRDLSDEFTKADYDIKYLFRAICNSQTYQRTSRAIDENEEDSSYFSHMPVRVMSPHQLFGSLGVALGREVTNPGRADNGMLKKGKKEGPKQQGPEAVIQAFDTRDYDESPAEYTYGIPQILRLMNRQVMAACDEVGKKAVAMGSDDAAIEHLYLSALSRRPTSAESQRVKTFIRAEPTPAKGYAMACWALVNCAEFISNR